MSFWLFSLVLEQYTVCDVCGLRSPSFQSNSVLYITNIDDTSLRELVMQELEGRLGKSCFKCKRNTRHLCFRQFLQPPKYLIVNVNRFSYVDNQFIKNRSLVSLDLNFMLGSYAFRLQATIDFHGFSMCCGHYIASVYCWEKTFYFNDEKITIYDTNHTGATAPNMSWFINCLWNEFMTRILRIGNIFSHDAGTFCSSHKLQVEE